MELRRRSFMILAGAAIGASCLPGQSAFAATSADFALVRTRWRDLMVGTGYNSSDPQFSSRIAALHASASGHKSSMSASGAVLWADLPLGSVSANVTGSFSRLLVMAKAWATPGGALSGDPATLSAILSGLDRLIASTYTATNSQYNNWWDWQIGSPQALLGTATIIHANLGTSRLSAIGAAVANNLSDAAVNASTGANRADMCVVRVLAGAETDNNALLTQGRDALSPTFPYVTAGDGFYADGSFIQHANIPYTNSYGAVFLGVVSRLFSVLAGTPWAVVDANRQVVFDAVTSSFAPVLHDGAAMDGMSGRSISRGLSTTGSLQSDHTRGHGILSSIALLAEAASLSESGTWKALVKGHFGRDTALSLANSPLDIPGLARVRAIMDSSSVVGSAESLGTKVFGRMDRAVTRNSSFAMAISMGSSRTAYYETGNGENLRGWHTSAGMVSWWGSGGSLADQYSDHYWATADPYHLPGTTTSLKTLANGAGGDWGASSPAATWAGGATDGTRAALGMTLTNLSSTLTGKKSWFIAGDKVVCLGANITALDGVGVHSILDSRNLGGTGGNTITVDGTAVADAPGATATATGASWAHIAGHGGYVMLGSGQPLRILRENRSGTWQAINTGSSSQSITRQYAQLFMDHGTNPNGSSYAYAMLPQKSVSETQSLAGSQSGWAQVLENTRYAQAVVFPAENLTAANFWEVPTTSVGGLSVTAVSSVVAHANGANGTLSVADPKQNATTVDVTWERAGTVTSPPSGVTVIEQGARMVLRVSLAGRAGASVVIPVNLS